MTRTLRNYMEDCVDSAIGTVLKDMDGCKCDRCICDIKAIALNNLPPKYIVTKKGQLYTKINSLQQQFDVDIISALTRAAVIVSKGPNHDDE